MLVKDVERGSRDRQSKEGADQGNGCPLPSARGEAAAGDGKTAPEQKKCGEELDREFGYRDGEVRPPDQGCHEAVEDAGLHLEGEEPGVVGIEGGIKPVVDRRKVNGVVFEAGMVTCDDQGPGAHDQQQNYVYVLTVNFKWFSRHSRKAWFQLRCSLRLLQRARTRQPRTPCSRPQD